MFLFIFLAVTVALCILAVKYLTGKKKPYSERSGTEKLAHTLHTKFEKFIKQLNDGIRTPEEIQTEMMEAVDDFKLTKLNAIKHTVSDIVKNIDRIKDNCVKLEKQRDIAKGKMEKALKEAQGPECEKKEAAKHEGARALRQIDMLSESIGQTEEAVAAMTKQLDRMHEFTQSFISKIEMKKTEILTMISNFIISDTSCMDIDINVDDLLTDYRMNMDAATEVNKITAIEHSYTQEPIDVCPDKYLNMFTEMAIGNAAR